MHTCTCVHTHRTNTMTKYFKQPVMQSCYSTVVFEGGGSLWPKISGRMMRRPPSTICARLDRPVNALQLCIWKFSHKETLLKTIRDKPNFYTENEKHSLLRPSLGVRGNVCCSSILMGSLESLYTDFLLVIIEFFLVSAFVLSQSTRLTDGQTDKKDAQRKTSPA